MATDERTVRYDSYELTARLETSESGTTTCTLYPTHVDGDGWTTTWISAVEGAFVNLANYR